MAAKNTPGLTEWVDPDDAPELTKEFFDQAEVYDGDRFIRRGRGRPKSDRTKEPVNIRLDPDVLARLREGGPGWQSRVNAILRDALAIDAPAQPSSRPITRAV